MHPTILTPAHDLYILDSDLCNLMNLWEMHHCRRPPPRLSREDVTSLLKTFLQIRLPTKVSDLPSIQFVNIYIGRILSQADTRYPSGLFPYFDGKLEVAQVRLRQERALDWDSTGWTEVTSGLWRRRLVLSHLLLKVILISF